MPVLPRAIASGFSEPHAEELLHAAPMHDTGKIGIPDAILMKHGKLDEDEWHVMRSQIGVRIIGEMIRNSCRWLAGSPCPITRMGR
jgi:response regulator RpfG family c-di-GMP phosphodiesterase